LDNSGKGGDIADCRYFRPYFAPGTGAVLMDESPDIFIFIIKSIQLSHKAMFSINYVFGTQKSGMYAFINTFTA